MFTLPPLLPVVWWVVEHSQTTRGIFLTLFGAVVTIHIQVFLIVVGYYWNKRGK